MAKQTAVDWLVQKYFNDYNILIPELEYEIAKQMEKEQIFNAFGVGCQVESTRLIGYHGMAEQYYNERYGNKN